ncbi:MAG: hypothetical protein HQL29_06570, partial [Candidatus Omnitrophica bacterium]|nr:hypothetical protein [Candidatus Omnitrophota bacterium]
MFIFILPLALSRQTNELYEFPKTVFFYIFSIFLLAIFLSVRIFKPFKLKPIPVAFWLFPVMAFISSLMSSHPHTSFFGYYTRFADSLLFYAALLVFYYVASTTLKREDLRTVFNVAQAGSIVLFIYALGQYSGAFSFLWKGQLQDRVFSTLGQPNWFAQYSLLLLGINFYGFLFKGRKSNLLFYIVQFFSLWLTFSMSGLAGFMVLVLVNIFILIREKEKKLLTSGYLKRLGVMFSISIFIAVLFPGIFSSKVRDIFIDAQKMVHTVSVVQASEEESISANLISDPAYIRSGIW